MILSGFATGLSWLCYYKALQDGQASVVVPIDKLSIVITIAFSYFILKEKYDSEFFRIYNPQMTKGKSYISGKGTSGDVTNNVIKTQTINHGTRNPTSILKFKRETGLHPTQKPVALLEYLIKTYTDEEMVVLDNCMGSGSTGVACMNTNRKFIGIELDENYFNIAKNRIKNAAARLIEI